MGGEGLHAICSSIRSMYIHRFSKFCKVFCFTCVHKDRLQRLYQLVLYADSIEYKVNWCLKLVKFVTLLVKRIL